MKHSSKRHPILIAAAVVVVLAAAAALVWFFWLREAVTAATATPVYVTQVSAIVGLDTGTQARYSGVVEPQETYAVNRDENRTVGEIFVEEGDEVAQGDPLFTYDTEEIRLSISQAELDLEGIQNQLATLQEQLGTLQEEKKNAGEEEQYSYTVQIQSVELDIRSQENNEAKKQAELDNLKKTLDNATVTSAVAGTVQEINETGSYDMYGNPTAFISILSSQEFRIKGTVSELNLSQIYEGMPVTVISRIDPTALWSGAVDTVSMEPASSDGSSGGYMSYYGVESGEQSSKYNFYVTIDDPTGLILGQHVYIEPTDSLTDRRTGLWLPGVYVVSEGTNRFVWARDDRDRLEKRRITVGDYDADEDLYQITGGLTRADSIAYPNDELRSGTPTTDDASLDTGRMPVEEGGSFSYDGATVDNGAAMDNSVATDDSAAVDAGGPVG